MLRNLVHRYFANLYARTMDHAYENAYELISAALADGGDCLDCGAGNGGHYFRLESRTGISQDRYQGIDWDSDSLNRAQNKGLTVARADLNRPLPFRDQHFQCVFALSVLEHLVNGCQFIRECRRVLKPGGQLVILTPNLSAWFNVVLLALGRMPSSGPHPDSAILLGEETPVKFRDVGDRHVEDAMPVDRHLVVFSYRVLYKFLTLCRFNDITAQAFGVYPFPNSVQPALERMDPWHCHQMVFTATR